MKKILSTLILLSILLVPVVAQAADSFLDSCTLRHDLRDADGDFLKCMTGPNATANCAKNTTIKDPGMCIVDRIMTIGDWLFAGLMAVSSIFIVWGGINYVTSGGDSTKFEEGRKKITYALVGVAVAFLSKAISSAVVMMLK